MEEKKSCKTAKIRLPPMRCSAQYLPESVENPNLGNVLVFSLLIQTWAFLQALVLTPHPFFLVLRIRPSFTCRNSIRMPCGTSTSTQLPAGTTHPPSLSRPCSQICPFPSFLCPISSRISLLSSHSQTKCCVSC